MNRLLIITSLALVAPAVVSCGACYAVNSLFDIATIATPEEPASSVKTPNPSMAPWRFVLGSPIDLAVSGVPRWGGTPVRWFTIWGMLAVVVLITCASLRNNLLFIPALAVGFGLAVPWISSLLQIVSIRSAFY